MAKKKKPVANPARGFATVSVASKPKVDKEPSATDEAVQSKSADATAVEQPNGLPSTLETSQSIVELSPEELEAQLERDELQLLVEKHASKVRRDAQRHILKFQTDRRVLRSQSDSLTVHDWIPNESIDRVIDLAQAESNDSNRNAGQQTLLKVVSEEDAIARLWTLDLTLSDMGFSAEYAEAASRWLCANAATVDSSASLWGLQEALEWLALDRCAEFHMSYSEVQPTRAMVESAAASRSATPLPDIPSPKTGNDSEVEGNTSSKPVAFSYVTNTPGDSDDGSVSDIDSDLDPDQLVSTWLRIKSKLFEIDPNLDGAQTSQKAKQSKGKSGSSQSSSRSPGVQKLISQLQRIEADTLFDEIEADTLWPVERNNIAKRKALDRLHRDTRPHDGDPSLLARQESGSRSATKRSPVVVHNDQTSDSEDSELLGDMFSAIPEVPSSNPDPKPGVTPDSVTLRDFGKALGLTPRRILEETVRARDSAVRLTYRMVSPTTYSCRHALRITWSKPQDVEADSIIEGINISARSNSIELEASNIAAISVEQSEGFISTVALFSLCAPSAKEEKVYLRLPANWRDVYKGFADQRRGRIDAEDRLIVKHFQALVRDQLENEESSGVVLTNRFKMRNQAAASPNSLYRTKISDNPAIDEIRTIWHQKATTDAFLHMLSFRSTLPVFGFREVILHTIDKNQVTIICGETGCGKSTQIPSFLLEHEMSQGKPCKIYCTEPRRISAISLAQRVSQELGEDSKDLGTPRSLVGYAIRLESKTTMQTRLVFATVGVILRMLESSRDFSEASHLIIDEVHERSIDTDFLLIILRSLMIARPELKVILMSATVDAQRFSQYLNNAPILNVPGRTFPVQVQYLEDAIELTHFTNAQDRQETNHSDDDGDVDAKKKSGIPSKLPGYSNATRTTLSGYDEYAIDYELIVRLIETVAFDPLFIKYSSAMLCFLPGIAEIRQLNDILASHPSFGKAWLIYPLHSTIASEEQQAAFLIPPPGMRKIVLATNIAETGVTIPDITCVIDTGKHKEMRFDERRQLSRLTQSFVSRANAKQRRGRAGRVQEGLCFHLFTKYRHDNLMTDQQTPEMLRLSLQDLVMRTKICKLGDIEKTLSGALDPPSSRNIRRAIDALIEVDALTPGEELTPLGRQIAKLPLDAQLGKLVLLASVFGCVDVAITVAAILTSKSPFLTPFGAKQRADGARLAFKKGDSDLLTVYNAYKSWKAVCTTSSRSEASFCNKNFLSMQNLGNIEDLKAQLLTSLVDAGFVIMTPDERRALGRYRANVRTRNFVVVPASHDLRSDNDILVNSVVAAAFYPKILTRDGKGWRNISNNQSVSLAPTSVNKATAVNSTSKEAGKYLSYYHIMQSASRFYNAHSTSVVHPLPMTLMVGGAADMDFKLHAGVIGMPGNVLRFAVKDWRAAVALKVLRRRLREVMAGCWRNPGRQLGSREREWMDIVFGMFGERFAREERLREKGGTKGK